MARRSDHSKEELGKLIFNSAKQIVAKKGFQELSARKLATQIKYTPGTIYSFYKSLDDLFMHINSDSLDLLHDKIHLAIEKEQNPEKTLILIAKKYIEFSIEEKNFWSLLFEYKYKDSHILPDWYLDKVKRNFSLVEEPLKHFSKKPKECKNLSRIIWASLNGIAVLSYRKKLSISDLKSSPELADIFIRNFVKGIAS